MLRSGGISLGGTVDEATMNKEVVEICEYILSSGANIVLETNTGACPAEVFTKLGNRPVISIIQFDSEI